MSNTYKFLNGVATELDDTIVSSEGLINALFIDTADSQYLNDLAKFFNLLRTSAETDEEFRARIKSYFLSLFGSGTGPELMDSAAILLSTDTSEMIVYEQAPLKASLRVTISTSQINLLTNLRSVIEQGKAAGVKIFLSYDTRAPTVLGIFQAGVSKLGDGSYVA